MSDALPGPFLEERDPQMQMVVDLSSEKVIRHLSQLMVFEYGCALFTDRREASLWYVTVAAYIVVKVAICTNGDVLGIKESHCLSVSK